MLDTVPSTDGSVATSMKALRTVDVKSCLQAPGRRWQADAGDIAGHVWTLQRQPGYESAKNTWSGERIDDRRWTFHIIESLTRRAISLARVSVQSAH
eukprot:Skav230536  [mRNA]  locus=scaffold1183:308962:309550:+ [translate_table: standard]